VRPNLTWGLAMPDLIIDILITLAAFWLLEHFLTPPI
jgi:hypothetical protein